MSEFQYMDPGSGRADFGSGEWVLHGRLEDASNATVLVSVGDFLGVYKPITGERPLHDFPTGARHGGLAHREVAAYLVSLWGGWSCIPTTVMVEGPGGLGSLTRWVGPPPDGLAQDVWPAEVVREWAQQPAPEISDVTAPVRILGVEEITPDWLPILQAQDADGEIVVVAHRDEPALRALALLDHVLNNADRKASHILPAREAGAAGSAKMSGGLAFWGIDHGLSFHPEPKLRTILWGWSGAKFLPSEVAQLKSLNDALGSTEHQLESLLPAAELDALHARLEGLLSAGAFPEVPPDRHVIPWPIF